MKLFLRDPISHYLQRFYSTKNPFHLFLAIIKTIHDKRIVETVYGIFNRIFYKPSIINCRLQNIETINHVLTSNKKFIKREHNISKHEIILRFGENYAVNKLPNDFIFSREEAIEEVSDRLIIGEYGSYGKRIFVITQNECKSINHYQKDQDIRHIHSIFFDDSTGVYHITVGDIAKYYDLWQFNNYGEFIFHKRVKKYLAGYSAICKIRNTIYFGSDFSNRPNYILAREDNIKYFFPRKISGYYVAAFKNFDERYLLSINVQLKIFGGKWAILIFDTHEKEFIYLKQFEFIESYESVNQPPIPS